MVKKVILIISALFSVLTPLCNKIFNLSLIWIIPCTFLCSCISLTVLYFVVLFFISLTIDKNKEYEELNPFYQFLFNITLEFIINLSLVKLTVEGLEKITSNQKFFLVTNHKSNFDPMIECMVLKKYNLIQISKPENFKIPICGPFMKRCCYLSINREDNREAVKTILNAAKKIKEGTFSVGIAPEGTRNKEGVGLLPFKAGSFKIGYKAEAPLVICTIKNTEKIHKNVPFKRTHVIMHIVDVIPYENYKDLSTQALSDEVRNKMNVDLGYEGENNK